MSSLYLVVLIISIGGLCVLDWRYRLAIFSHTKRGLVTLAIAIAAFVIWDLLGIGLGVFFHGGSEYTLAYRLFPEFPIEELFFLVLLNYCALLGWRIYDRVKK